MSHIELMTVVLHYGDPAMTARLVAALAQGGAVVRVLDNSAPLSYEGQGQWLRLEHNVFWAGAFAVALEQARALGATHLWFCNNDIRMDSPPPYVPRMAARLGRLARVLAEAGQAPGIVAPSVLRTPYHPQMIHRSGVAWSQVACVDGIAPVVSLACVHAVGGLDADDNPRGYGVDVWLSLRASRAGWPVVVDHGMVLRHDYHTTARDVPGFMATAASDEDRYLTARMGADWRKQVTALQQQRLDIME